MNPITHQKAPDRKPLPIASCIFADSWWNDSAQRNYILYECKNQENIGGETGESPGHDLHGTRTYSCHHKNEGMAYRCLSEPEKIAECPIALTNTKPEIDCEKFIEEKAHPLIALVSKEELKERFYQPDAYCISCGNCLESNN